MRIHSLYLIMVLATSTACESTAPTPATLPANRLLLADESSCAITPASGSVYCWGANTNRFEYGVSPSERPGSPTPVPVPVPELASFARGTGTHRCGITADDVGVCWGRGGFGQLGGGDLGDAGNGPTYVSTPKRWRQIAVSRLTTCGVTTDGAGYCWGANQRGEVGDETVPLTTATASPREIMGGLTWKSVVPGWLHACGITDAGTALCWGNNPSGQLGVGFADTSAHRVPEPVAGGHTFAQLTLGARHTCAITNEGVAYCWGQNAFGEVGDGTTELRSAPTRVSGTRRYTLIVTASGFGGGTSDPSPTTLQGGVGHTCALSESGAAYCWGWNEKGQLGDGSMIDSHFPVAVQGGLTFETIALGGSHTCGMRALSIWCWGSNTFSQLGNGTNLPSAVPVQVFPSFSPFVGNRQGRFAAMPRIPVNSRMLRMPPVPASTR